LAMAKPIPGPTPITVHNLFMLKNNQ